MAKNLLSIKDLSKDEILDLIKFSNSFIDNEGNLLFTSMIDNPQVFITTIGLYNDSNDLVAVAKLSQPIKKDFTKEALIRVKLDY